MGQDGERPKEVKSNAGSIENIQLILMIGGLCTANVMLCPEQTFSVDIHSGNDTSGSH